MIAYVEGENTIVFNHEGSGEIVLTPAGMLSDPRFLLSAMAFRVGNDGEATVVLDKGLDWSGVEGAGWTPAAYQAGQHWRAFVKDGRRINVVTLADRDEYANDPLTAPKGTGVWTDAVQVAAALCQWWRVTGTHYYATPGVAAIINLRRGWGEGPQPMWRLINHADARPWKPPASIEAIQWTAKPKPRDMMLRWDMRSAYLAAMAAVQLPFRQLVPTGTEPTTLECGYYRVRINAGFDEPWPGGWPSWAMPTPDRQDTVWVCQGTLGLMTGPEIIDSYTPRQTAQASGYRRLLRHWAEDWRDVHLADPAPLKQAYAQLVGLMNVPSGQLYRPDWRHMIIDQQRASMIRRIGKVAQETGMEPVAVQTDAVYYRAGAYSDRIEPHLGVGPRMGNMRFEGLCKL